MNKQVEQVKKHINNNKICKNKQIKENRLIKRHTNK